MHRLAIAAALPLLLAGALLVPGLPRAGAAPSTDAFEGLLVELNDRDAALPDTGLTREQRKWKGALRKAFRAMARSSDDLVGDLRMGVKISRALEKGYPGDTVIEGLLDGALDDLTALVHTDRDRLEVTASLLADGRPKTKALALLGSADGRLALAQAAATATLRAKQLQKGQGFVVRGERIAGKGDPGGPTGSSVMTATVRGTPWAANSDFGTAVSGLAVVSEASGGLRRLLVRGRRILPGAGSPPLPGDESTLELSLQAVTGNLGPGTYSVGNVGGFSTGATWREETGEGLSNGLAISGTVTLATVEVHAGSVTVTGGFSLVVWDGITGGTFSASSGLFEAYDLPRSTE